MQLAHISIYRLLVDEDGLQSFDPNATASTHHFGIFELCTKYMERDQLTKESLKITQYVFSFYLEHARHCNELLQERRFVYPRFLTECSRPTKQIVYLTYKNMIRRGHLSKFTARGSITGEKRLVCLLAAEGCRHLLLMHQGCRACYGTNVSFEDKEDMLGNALIQAVEQNREETVELLVKQLKCNVNFSEGPTSKTPLVRAISLGAENMVAKLLELGAQVDKCVSITSRSPLNTAVGYRNSNIVRALLSHPGVDRRRLLRQPDWEGQYALHIAARHGLLPVVKILFETCERDEIDYMVTLRDENGENAFRVAMRAGNHQIAHFISDSPCHGNVED